MKNLEVIQAFLRQVPAKSRNLYSFGNVLSYCGTVVALWRYNVLYINGNHYTESISRVQKLLRSSLRADEPVILENMEY